MRASQMQMQMQQDDQYRRPDQAAQHPQRRRNCVRQLSPSPSTSTHNRRPHHTWPALVAVPAAMLCWSVPAAAQMSADMMAPAAPDWRSAHTLLPLVFFVPTLPIYLVGLLLLFRRRGLYPIAGRGWLLLFLSGANMLLGGLLNCLLMIFYPRGVPCGMHVLLLWWYIPVAVCMLVRAALLVFRLEIQNYLAELAWRQSKMTRLRERGLLQDAEGDGGASRGAGSAPSSKAEDSSVAVTSSAARPYACPLGPLEPPSLDSASIPGHAFITRRWMVAPRTVLTTLGVATVFAVIVFTLVIVFDHDVSMTAAWRAERGLADDGYSSHFVPFSEGPRCFAYSIKSATFLCLILVIAPFIVWCAWRIRLNAQRMLQRTNEQKAFEDALHQQQQQQQHELQVKIDSGPSAHPPHPPHSDRSHDVHAAKELDELSAVKTELLTVAALGLTGTVMATAELDFAYEWINLHMVIIDFLIFCVVCVPPLYYSYIIQRRHRELMQRTRQGSQNSGSRGGGGGGGGNRLLALVPHHRPLYRLKHVLSDAYTYPVLLKFLQKEYSSENALFYLEARRFSAFCRGLELSVPGWTSSLDDDASSASGPSLDAWNSDNGNGAGSSMVGQRLVSTERVTIGNQPQRQKSPSLPVLGPQSVPTPDLADTASPSLQPVDLSSVVEMAPSAKNTPLFTSSTSATQRGTRATSPAVRSTSAGGRRSAGNSAGVSAGDERDEHEVAMASPPNPSAAQKHAAALIRAEWPMDSDGSSALQLPGSTAAAAAPGQAAAAAAATAAAVPVTPVASVPTTTWQNHSRMASSTKTALLHAPAPHRSALRGRVPNAAHHSTSLRQLHEQAARARTWALQLHTDFIQTNAVYQINIANDIAKMLSAQIKQLQQWQPTPLDSAGQPDTDRAVIESSPPSPPPFPLSSLYQQTALSVFSLMETDSFRRFLLTPDFEQLLQRADDLEMERLGAQSDVNAATQALLQRADAMLQGAGQASPTPSPPEPSHRSPPELNMVQALHSPLRAASHQTELIAHPQLQ